MTRSAVDILNAPNPSTIASPVAAALDRLQLRIINLRKRTVSERGVANYARAQPALDRAQSIYYEVASDLEKELGTGRRDSAWAGHAAKQSRSLLARVHSAQILLDKLGGD